MDTWGPHPLSAAVSRTWAVTEVSLSGSAGAVSVANLLWWDPGWHPHWRSAQRPGGSEAGGGVTPPPPVV